MIFFLTKFTPKAGQIYPRLRTPGAAITAFALLRVDLGSFSMSSYTDFKNSLYCFLPGAQHERDIAENNPANSLW